MLTKMQVRKCSYQDTICPHMIYIDGEVYCNLIKFENCDNLLIKENENVTSNRRINERKG